LEKVVDIIESIAYEKNLKIDDVKEAIKEAIVKVAKETINKDFEYDIEIDEKSKKLKLLQKVKVVSDEDIFVNKDGYIGLSEAREVDSNVNVGDELSGVLHNLEELGRSAINMLYSEIDYRIQLLVERELFEKYKSKVNTIVNGIVVRIDEFQNTYIEINEIRATLPKKNRIKGESFKVGDTVRSILRFINIDNRNGIQIELSRTAPKFLEALLLKEVPEIQDGLIEIEGCARIPGDRAKISLISHDNNIDAVGSVVGIKGTRVTSVSSVLNGERIDCIEFSPIKNLFVARSLSPAIINNVKMVSDRKAIVKLPSDQKAKAIGRGGVNIRLASMLTQCEIELVEEKTMASQPMAGSKNNKSEYSQEKTKDTQVLESLFK